MRSVIVVALLLFLIALVGAGERWIEKEESQLNANRLTILKELKALSYSRNYHDSMLKVSQNIKELPTRLEAKKRLIEHFDRLKKSFDLIVQNAIVDSNDALRMEVRFNLPRVTPQLLSKLLYLELDQVLVEVVAFTYEEGALTLQMHWHAVYKDQL